MRDTHLAVFLSIIVFLLLSIDMAFFYEIDILYTRIDSLTDTIDHMERLINSLD